MPVDTRHSEYSGHKEIWKRCRDVVSGEDAVKAGGSVYLPMLSSHVKKPKDYDSYKMRALFYNASGRTLHAMIGSVFRIDPVIAPESDYVKARTRAVFEEVATVGRVGILVDAPKEGGEPYFVIYKAEDIVNWRYSLVGDTKKLTLVVLREIKPEVDEKDEYKNDLVTYYRVLQLKDGVYTQSLYKEKQVGQTAVSHDLVAGFPVTPTQKGKAVLDIPFVIIGSLDVSPDVDNPPMLDLINVNLSHYRTSADIEHGRHFTALPTAWVAGFSTDTVLEIGSGTAWVTDNTAATAGFLEFTGQGLGALETAMAEKEALMAAHGARLFSSNKNGVESADALRIKSASETSVIVGMANSASDGLTIAYQWLLDFRLATPGTGASVKLNTDLIDASLNPQEVGALVAAWQGGALSLSTLLYNFKQGELIQPDRSVEEEQALIEAESATIKAEAAAMSKLSGDNKQQTEPA